MKVELDIEQLQAKRSEIEDILSKQNRKLSSKFETELEQQFWQDREERLVKMIARAVIPAIMMFILFEFISLPINYLTTEPEHKFHDVGLTLISYSAGWVALVSIILMAKRPSWNHYYKHVVATVICFGLFVVQSSLLSTNSLSMMWRGTIIISLATMFAYLCSGLRPRMTFYASSISAILTCLLLWLTKVKLPIWVLTNTLILPNLVGLALAVMTISTERIRFLQSIIIEYDKLIYSLLNQHFIHLSHQDTLTLLGNRRGFEQSIDVAITDTQTSNEPFAVLFIDVDFFKLYNDFYGHDKGDEALIRVAQTLLRNISENDLAIRYGGEEFVVILKNTTLKQAEDVAQKILNDITDQKIEHQSSNIEKHLTVSIGLTVYSSEQNVFYQDLLKLADQALYLAKNEGRNRFKTINLK